jgi:hypothetical protein
LVHQSLEMIPVSVLPLFLMVLLVMKEVLSSLDLKKEDQNI